MDMFAGKVDISHVAQNDDLCDIDILMILSWCYNDYPIRTQYKYICSYWQKALIFSEKRSVEARIMRLTFAIFSWLVLMGMPAKAVSNICNDKRPAVNLNEMKLGDNAFNRYPLCGYTMHRLILLISWVHFSIFENLVRIKLIAMF